MSAYDDVVPGPAGASIVHRDSLRVLPLSIGNPGTTHALTGLAGLLMGWCIRENTGSATASANLYDGGDSSETILAAISLPAGGLTVATFFPDGIDVLSGLFFSAVSGQMRGVVYYRADSGAFT